MRRTLFILFASATCLLGGAQGSASATEYDVSREATFAVTTNFVYWERWSPRGCKGCAELWRTPIAGGRNELIHRVRKGTIDTLRAGGDVLAYTVTVNSRLYRTSVRAIKDSGPQEILAKAKYRPTGRRNCGSQVTAGAVSREGEVAWERADVSRSDEGCDELPDGVKWSAWAGGPGLPARQLLAPRAVAPIRFFGRADFEEALFTLHPIQAYEGGRILAGAFLNKLNLYATPNGASRSFTSSRSGFAWAGDLTPSGAVYANLAVEVENDWVEWPVLFPTLSEPRQIVDLSIKRFEFHTVHFCGDQLIQLASGETGVRLVRRTLDGAIVTAENFRTDVSDDEANFECTDDVAVVSYVGRSKASEDFKRRTFSVALKQ